MHRVGSLSFYALLGLALGLIGVTYHLASQPLTLEQESTSVMVLPEHVEVVKTHVQGQRITIGHRIHCERFVIVPSLYGLNPKGAPLDVPPSIEELRFTINAAILCEQAIESGTSILFTGHLVENRCHLGKPILVITAARLGDTVIQMR
jgi:hypothetical protein